MPLRDEDDEEDEDEDEKEEGKELGHSKRSQEIHSTNREKTMLIC